jgi:uncharacterized protein (UPF0276 family)
MRDKVCCASGETSLGLSYGPGIHAFLAEHREFVDFVEIPFEQLRHAPQLSATISVPVVLHCASLSMAGFVPADAQLLDALEVTVSATGSPWIGEHLAFVSADPVQPGLSPTHLSYTVMPPLSDEVLAQVALNIARYSERFSVPILLENPPEYFTPPGSRMDQAEFVSKLARETGVGLILDLSHLAITAYNLGSDLDDLFDRFPLERVVEVHISGHSEQRGVMWDDHSVRAPESAFGLLERLLQRVRPRAVTLEYNWDAFPPAALRHHLSRAREILAT